MSLTLAHIILQLRAGSIDAADIVRTSGVSAPILHGFLHQQAEAILHQEEELGRRPDPRSWEALDGKWDWLWGRCGDVELDGLVDAAEDATTLLSSTGSDLLGGLLTGLGQLFRDSREGHAASALGAGLGFVRQLANPTAFAFASHLASDAAAKVASRHALLTPLAAASTATLDGAAGAQAHEWAGGAALDALVAYHAYDKMLKEAKEVPGHLSGWLSQALQGDLLEGWLEQLQGGFAHADSWFVGFHQESQREISLALATQLEALQQKHRLLLDILVRRAAHVEREVDRWRLQMEDDCFDAQ